MVPRFRIGEAAPPLSHTLSWRAVWRLCSERLSDETDHGIVLYTVLQPVPPTLHFSTRFRSRHEPSTACTGSFTAHNSHSCPVDVIRALALLGSCFRSHIHLERVTAHKLCLFLKFCTLTYIISRILAKYNTCHLMVSSETL